MKKLIFSLIMAGCSLQAFAQQELIHPKEQSKQGYIAELQPYIQVNGQPTIQPSLQLLSPDDIGGIEIIKDAKETARFGEKAKDGVILIQTKPEVTLVGLSGIYSHFKVPAAQQKLKVVINDRLIKDTSLIVANLDEIARVEIIKQEVTAPVRWSLHEEEEFLRIVPKEKKR